MKKKEGGKLLDDLLSMFGDRAIYLALLFSLAAHGAVMLFLKDWPGTPESRKPAMIAVRLIRLPDTLPDQERGAGGEEAGKREDGGGLPRRRRGRILSLQRMERGKKWFRPSGPPVSRGAPAWL